MAVRPKLGPKLCLQFLSDLHLEMRKPKHGWLLAKRTVDAAKPDITILVLAGDIGHVSHIRTFLTALGNRYRHIVYVCGNHEFYGKRPVADILQSTRDLSLEFPHLHVLQNDILTCDQIPELGETRILGATLWSHIDDEAVPLMNDYIHINVEYRQRITCKETREWHARDVSWLRINLREGDLVVTHYPPSYTTLDPKYDAKYASAYASHLDEFIRSRRPAGWIFGHTHHAFIGKIGQTLLVSNPVGYVNQDTGVNFGQNLSIC